MRWLQIATDFFPAKTNQSQRPFLSDRDKARATKKLRTIMNTTLRSSKRSSAVKATKINSMHVQQMSTKKYKKKRVC